MEVGESGRDGWGEWVKMREMCENGGSGFGEMLMMNRSPGGRWKMCLNGFEERVNFEVGG